MTTNQTCKKCFREQRFEFFIKDEIWKMLPGTWQNHVLCFECFLEELETAAPGKRLSLNDFYFLGVVGTDNSMFGGIFLDSDSRKNRKIILGE